MKKGPILSMRTLQGIQEVMPPLDSRLDEVHGLWDRDVGSLKRVPGKLLSGTGGSMWNVAQIHFREGSPIIIHAASTIFSFETPPPLPGLVFPPLVFPPPLNDGDGAPPGFPPDWPGDSPVDPPDPPGSQPGDGPNTDWPPGDHVPMTLTAIPTVTRFETSLDEGTSTKNFRVKKSDAVPGGGSKVKVVWVEKTWMSLAQIVGINTISLSSGDLVDLGAWSSADGADLLFSLTANAGALESEGTHTVSIMFTVVESDGNYPLEGTAVCVELVILEADGPEVSMLTGVPTWYIPVRDAV